jgi:hypothetical protein
MKEIAVFFFSHPLKSLFRSVVYFLSKNKGERIHTVRQKQGWCLVNWGIFPTTYFVGK